MSSNQPLVAVRIKDGLFVGNATAAQDDEFLFLNKVQHVVNCCSAEVSNLFAQANVQYLAFPWKDLPNTVMFDSHDRNVDQIFKFVEKGLKDGECVLVHSYHGVSRSCAVVAAYLMVKYGWSVDSTLTFMAVAHPDMNIKPHFMRQLRGFAKRQPEDPDVFNPYVDTSELALDNEQWALRNTYLNALSTDVLNRSEIVSVMRRYHLSPELVNYSTTPKHVNRRRITYIDTKQGTTVASSVTIPVQHQRAATPSGRPSHPILVDTNYAPQRHLLLSSVSVDAKGRQTFRLLPKADAPVPSSDVQLGAGRGGDVYPPRVDYVASGTHHHHYLTHSPSAGSLLQQQKIQQQSSSVPNSPRHSQQQLDPVMMRRDPAPSAPSSSLPGRQGITHPMHIRPGTPQPQQQQQPQPQPQPPARAQTAPRGSTVHSPFILKASAGARRGSPMPEARKHMPTRDTSGMNSLNRATASSSSSLQQQSSAQRAPPPRTSSPLSRPQHQQQQHHSSMMGPSAATYGSAVDPMMPRKTYTTIHNTGNVRAGSPTQRRTTPTSQGQHADPSSSVTLGMGLRTFMHERDRDPPGSMYGPGAPSMTSYGRPSTPTGFSSSLPSSVQQRVGSAGQRASTPTERDRHLGYISSTYTTNSSSGTSSPRVARPTMASNRKNVRTMM
eukprot:PhM_4_TR18870/c1_g1_i1/m.82943